MNSVKEHNEVDELKNAVKMALQRKGLLTKMKSNLRAEIFNCIEDKTVNKPEVTSEIQLSFDLIKEFLQVFQFDNSLAVFNEESTGQSNTDNHLNSDHNNSMKVDRNMLATQLGITIDEKDKNIPLLILLTSHYQGRNNPL